MTRTPGAPPGDDPRSAGKAEAEAARKRRLADALRDNLRKRKTGAAEGGEVAPKKAGGPKAKR